MFAEQGAFELVFLAAVALIVVGPKDLPVLLRKVGQFTAKMRGLAAEFRASFDEMARQSELDELRKEVEALRQGVTAPNLHQMMGSGPVARDLEQHFDELHHGLIPAPTVGTAPTADVHSVHSVHPVSEHARSDGAAPSAAGSADSPDSPGSVSRTPTPVAVGRADSPDSPDSRFAPSEAPGERVHLVHSVHPENAWSAPPEPRG